MVVCDNKLAILLQSTLCQWYDVLIQCIGEFGIVYKAQLVDSTKQIPTFVAVKTLRGCVTCERSKEFYSRKFIVCVS